MSDITETQVRHVARLARLKLSDDEVARFTRQLGGILDYVAKLEELDLTGIEPMAHPTDMTNRFREDLPGEPLTVDAALANAPGKDAPYFKVPKVLGEGSGA